MARRTKIRSFPLVEGEHGEADSRILPDGYVTRMKNLRLRKDGRWGVRSDFDALGNDTQGSNDLVPRDLVGYGDALCALGDSSGVASDSAIWDIHDYTGTTPAEWQPSAGFSSTIAQLRLSDVSNLRTLPAYTPSLIAAGTSVTQIDCAAAGGVVCVAYTDGSTCFYHFFRASTGSTILEATLSGSRPRVVAVSTTFFYTAFNAGTGLVLSKYDPTTDAAASALTAPTGSALNCFDVVPRRSGTGFWIVFNTTTPTTSIVPYDSSGVAGTAITGPASAFNHVTLTETANRVHLVAISSAPAGSAYSYTLAGALSTGPTSFSVACDDAQPGAVDSTYNGTEQFTPYWSRTSGGITFISAQYFNATTHVTGGAVAAAAGFFAAKPIVSGTPNYHGIVGSVGNDGAFFSAFLSAVVPSDVATPPALVSTLISKFAAAKIATAHVPKIAKDTSTGKFYWPSLIVDDQSVSRPRVAEFDWLSSNRRQTAQIAGLLYIGGGALGVYDSRLLCQAGHFLKPRITSATPSNGAGSLPSSVDLLVAVVREGRDAFGNIVEGDISDTTTVTMGAAEDTITLAVSGSIGLPVGDSIFVGYRSIEGINQLRRAETTTTSSLVYLAADSTVRTHGVVYTQAGRGALSGSLPHEAPLPADYLWKFGDRLLCANANQAFVSKSLFPGEQVTFSGAVGFLLPSIPERIYGVAALDQRGLIFSAERIYQFSGEGPNDNGEGRYSEPVPIPGSTGLLTWQSLVETPIGLFFQGSNGQIWLLPRDGSPAVWIGQPVRDTLVDYPNVTSAVLVTKEQLVCFTCNNSGNTDSRIVCFDLRAKTWIVDEFASSTPITAACSYAGRLAILSSGIVYTEKSSLTPNSFIEHGFATGTLKPASWQKFVAGGVLGEYRGDCNLRCRVSYDDGKNYTTLSTTHQLRSTEFAVGATVQKEWVLPIWKTDGIRLEFMAQTPGSASEGMVFNEWWIEIMGERGGPRLASGQRG